MGARRSPRAPSRPADRTAPAPPHSHHPARAPRATGADDEPPAPPPPSGDGKTFYNDERALPPRTEMSDAYKKKLRDEYVSFGGSPNTAMGSNYFLWIILGISVLAVLSWLTGSI
jgi:L-ascorbate peroxidase